MTVVQGDRDAAARVARYFGEHYCADRFAAGEDDESSVVQEIAAHRRAATISTPREDEVERVNGFPATREQWGEMADCPFCKARADEFNIGVTYSTGVEDRKNIRSYMSECAECGAMGPTADTEEEALRLWNALATLTPREQRMEEALRPFAAEAENYDYGDGSGPDLNGSPDESSLNEVNDLLVGDLRRARSALSLQDKT